MSFQCLTASAEVVRLQLKHYKSHCAYLITKAIFTLLIFNIILVCVRIEGQTKDKKKDIKVFFLLKFKGKFKNSKVVLLSLGTKEFTV